MLEVHLAVIIAGAPFGSTNGAPWTQPVVIACTMMKRGPLPEGLCTHGPSSAQYHVRGVAW